MSTRQQSGNFSEYFKKLITSSQNPLTRNFVRIHTVASSLWFLGKTATSKNDEITLHHSIFWRFLIVLWVKMW